VLEAQAVMTLPWRPEQIISGGQTGADRGGLEAAIALGLLHGGWVPKGRRAEDGMVPARYQLRETASVDYVTRTLQNIAEANGTLVFSFDRKTAGPGTRLTIESALRMRRPCFFVELHASTKLQVVTAVRSWLRARKPRVLNVAGSRESTCPRIEREVKELLVRALS
jgi:hypothetical protein